MDRLSRFVLARVSCVVSAAVALLLLGGVAVVLLLPRVSEANEYPDLAAHQANERIERAVGTGGYERPLVPVVSLPDDVSLGDVHDEVAGAFAAGAEVAAGRLAGFDTGGIRTADGTNLFVGDDGRTVYGLIYPPRTTVGGLPGSAIGEGPHLQEQTTEVMRAELPLGSEVAITGLDAIATGADAGGLNVPVKLAVTVGMALVVMVWIFRSSLAFVPLLMALLAVPVSFLGLLVASPFMTVHETTIIMLPLFGVGIAIDYAIIVVSRWREEQRNGTEPADAVHRAMSTAGGAVAFSAVAVALGLLTMVVLPIPLLRSLGVGAMLVTAASALVTLTLLPIVLHRYGHRMLRRSSGDEYRAAQERATANWARFAGWVVRQRRLVAAGSGGILLALCAVATQLNLNLPASDDMATSGPGRFGLTTLADAGVPSGVLTSFDIFVPESADMVAVSQDLASLPGIHGVVAPGTPDWTGAGGSVLTVVPTDEAGTGAGRSTIERVIDTVSVFPWMMALVAVVTFLVLARAFRSVLLPIKAITVNLLSLGAVLGALVLLWQWGWGTEAVFGIRPDGSVGTFVPVTVFAFLYGLSMDYEVFILSRVREEFDRTGSTPRAVINGVARTGRLVTAAALILFFAFASMSMGGELDVAVFASGLALGILLDATVIRALLVPATVAMIGRWNWWLPAWLARSLRVEPAVSR